MKLNIQQLLIFIASIVSSIIMFLAFTSCSKEFHERKWFEKGGVIEPDTITKTITVTIKGKDGEDSLIYVLVNVPCPTIEAPKTRFEIRNDRKSDKDSLKHVERMYKLKYKFIIDSLQKDNKRLHIENKRAKIGIKELKSNNKVRIKEVKAETKQKTANNKSWNLTMIVIAVCSDLLIIMIIIKKI